MHISFFYKKKTLKCLLLFIISFLDFFLNIFMNFRLIDILYQNICRYIFDISIKSKYQYIYDYRCFHLGHNRVESKWTLTSGISSQYNNIFNRKKVHKCIKILFSKLIPM